MLTLKGDHNFSTRHRLSATFNRNFRSRTNSPGGRWGLPPGTPTGVYQNQDTPGTLVRLAYDWTVTPTILNHAAIGYNRFGNSNVSAFFMQDWPQKIGMQNVPGTHFPTLTFSGRAEQSGTIGAGGRLGSGNSNVNYNGSTIGQDDLTIFMDGTISSWDSNSVATITTTRATRPPGRSRFRRTRPRSPASPRRPAMRSRASCWERRPARAAA